MHYFGTVICDIKIKLSNFVWLRFGTRRFVNFHLGLVVSTYLVVSKNRGIPKWMVKIMENPIEMDDLGVPLFLETSIFSPEPTKLNVAGS